MKLYDMIPVCVPIEGYITKGWLYLFLNCFLEFFHNQIFLNDRKLSTHIHLFLQPANIKALTMFQADTVLGATYTRMCKVHITLLVIEFTFKRGDRH
jgi:hypothetical protein